MSKSLLRLLMAVSLCLGLGLTACGPDDENNTSNNGGECTDNSDCSGDQVCDTDTNMCVDPSVECEMDSDCDEGDECDTDTNTCVPESECEVDSDCDEGEECNNGMCEIVQAECTDDTECGAGEFCTEDGQCDSGQCASVSPGESCDPNGDPAGNGLVCVGIAEGSAVCAETCTPPGEDEDDPCTSGSECLPLDDQGTAGACVVTQCELGAGECDSGATCQPISQDTNLCMTSGGGAEGDSCLEEFGSLEASPCGEELFCDIFYTGECKKGCNDDAQCDQLDTCVGSGNSEIFTSPEGFCDEGCEPFGDRDVCGEGFGCFPLTADEGLCQEAGDTGIYESCTVTACNADSDCPTDVDCNTDAEVCDYGAQCAGDARCVTLEAASGPGTDGLARCMPACDPTADDPNATCPTANPKSFIRFQHLSVAADTTGISSVDVYVDDNSFATDVSFPPTGAVAALPYSEVDPGSHNIKIYETGADPSSDDPILEDDVELDANAQVTYLVVDGPDGSGGVVPSIQSFTAPRGVEPVSDAIKLRVFHGIPNLPTNVDIYVVAAGSDLADRASDNIPDPIVADLGYGMVNVFPDGSGGTMPFETLPGGGAQFDAYISKKDGNPEQGSNLLGTVTGLSAPDGSVLTLAAIADQDGPTSVALPYSSEDETRVLGGFCLDLAQTADESSPQSGVCFENCGTADNLGKELCSESADNCAPFRANSVCLPSDDLEVGDTCPTDAFNPCEAGSYCRAYGDGTGLCSKLCTTDDSEHPLLGCPTEEACEEISADYDVGLCGFECSATDFADETCPDNLENCLSTTEDFCSASGSETGDGCTITPNSCEAGNICRAEVVSQANSTLIDGLLQPIQPVDGATQSCRTLCDVDPSASETGCPGDEVCALEVGTLSKDWGFCMESVGSDACTQDNFGQPCADRGYCGAGPNGPACLEFCLVGASETGCSTGTCQAAFQSPDGTIEGWGICL